MKTTHLKTLLIAGLALFTVASCQKEESFFFDVHPHHFLAEDKFDALNVEVVAVEGHEPNQAALDNLENFLESRLNKSRGVTIVQRTVSSPKNNSFTAQDLRDLEDDLRSEYAENSTLTGYIFYADEGYVEDTENSQVLGLAYSSTSMCIFKDAITENSGGFGQVSEENLETAVLKHEFGHVLGLVNNGTPMVQNHEDPNRRGHCDNENCLMYYASETGDMLGFLGGNEVPGLDSQCIADLQANGGK